jgi:hypothetical protein
MAKRTPETLVKDHFKVMVQVMLTERFIPHKLVYNAGSAFGGADTVDCTGVIAGYSVAFEFKRFDKKGKLTARQKLSLQEFASAGAVTCVIDSEEKMRDVADWFRTLPDYRMLIRNPLTW